MTTLLADVNAFLAATGMSETAFGREAMGDPSFMIDLKGGKRRFWPETEQRARDFMRERLASVRVRA